MRKILVTGGNGQLGSELKDLAAARPADEFTFVDLGDLDISDEASVQTYMSDRNFDFIINCAAYTAVDKAEEEKQLSEKVNADAVRILSTISVRKKIRLIHISTDYVFDGEFNQPIGEDAVPNPLSVYGRTKLQGEKYLPADAYLIRTSWVYSTYGKNFVKTILNLARQREELSIVADQYGTPTYARDLAKVVLSIIDSGKDAPGTYHYSNEGATTWFDFAYSIKEHFNLPCRVKPIRTAEYKTAAVRPKFSVLDKTRIKRTFDINIPHWSQSLKECLNKLEQ